MGMKPQSPFKPGPEFFSPLWCWSCQSPLTSENEVKLDERGAAPCCLTCWGKLNIEQRLRLAQLFRDRLDGGVVEAMTTLFRSSLAKFVEESGGDQWLRGRDGN